MIKTNKNFETMDDKTKYLYLSHIIRLTKSYSQIRELPPTYQYPLIIILYESIKPKLEIDLTNENSFATNIIEFIKNPINSFMVTINLIEDVWENLDPIKYPIERTNLTNCLIEIEISTNIDNLTKLLFKLYPENKFLTKLFLINM